MLFILCYSYCNRSLDRLSWGNSIHSWQPEYIEVQNTFHCGRKVSFPSQPSPSLPPYSSINALSWEIQHLPLNMKACGVWLSDSRTNKSSPLPYQFLELWNKWCHYLFHVPTLQITDCETLSFHTLASKYPYLISFARIYIPWLVLFYWDSGLI